jgi:rhamnulokinase
VDLGATSVRVCRVDLDASPLICEVIHRVAHRPKILTDGSLRWDWGLIIDAVQTGLAAALEAGPVASIGVDGWGVDYGLINRAGSLIGDPHCYRSNRTLGWREVAARLGPERLYAMTGIQAMPINTLFQLAFEDKDLLGDADRLLMVPELVVWALTGEAAGEVTSAGTTGMLDVRTRQWVSDLAIEIGLRPEILPELQPAGTPVGAWQGVPVHLVAGHDTASAVAALPPSNGPQGRRAFLSTGSWFLAGTCVDEPITTPEARRANLSNEPAVFGGVRLLRNLTGLVLLERLRDQWGSPPIEQLAAVASELAPEPLVVDTDSPELGSANDVEAVLRNLGRLPSSAGRNRVVRLLVDSLAARVASALDEIGAVVREPIAEVVVGGGGTRIPALLNALRETTGLVVAKGPQEASAMGNALVQGVAIGRFSSLEHARVAVQ